MLNYLSAEASFLRAFGNRSLLLIFLCALSRTGEKIANASVLGLSLSVSPGIIVVYGPLLTLFLLVGLKTESDSLWVAREAILSDASKLPTRARRPKWAVYLLF